MNLDASLEPRLDLAIIDQVRKLGAVRPGLLQRLVEKFDDGTGEFLAFAAGHAGSETAQERMRQGFHSLKGSAAGLGATRLSALAWEAERACGADGAADALAARIDAVRDEFAHAMHALRQYVEANA